MGFTVSSAQLILQVTRSKYPVSLPLSIITLSKTEHRELQYINVYPPLEYNRFD